MSEEQTSTEALTAAKAVELQPITAVGPQEFTIVGDDYDRLLVKQRKLEGLVKEANTELEDVQAKWDDVIEPANKDFWDDVTQACGFVPGTPLEIDRKTKGRKMVVRYVPPKPGAANVPTGELPPGIAALVAAAGAQGIEVKVHQGEHVPANGNTPQE